MIDMSFGNKPFFAGAEIAVRGEVSDWKKFEDAVKVILSQHEFPNSCCHSLGIHRSSLFFKPSTHQERRVLTSKLDDFEFESSGKTLRSERGWMIVSRYIEDFYEFIEQIVRDIVEICKVGISFKVFYEAGSHSIG